MPKKTKIQANADQCSGISAKLDTLIRLSALNVIKDIKPQKEQIRTLSDAGFGPSEIADILKTSSNTVSVTLSAIRKERTSAQVEEQKPAEAPVETPTAEEAKTGEDGSA